VDAAPRPRRLNRRRKELISRNEAKPLADSNRGPPPYHCVVHATIGNRRRRNRLG
jgi:hypothetical protein